MNKPNREQAKKYPIIPYLVVMLIAVVAIVLLSYFAQQRNNSLKLNQYNEEHIYQFKDIDTRLEELETRVSKIESTID